MAENDINIDIDGPCSLCGKATGDVKMRAVISDEGKMSAVTFPATCSQCERMPADFVITASGQVPIKTKDSLNVH